MSIRSFAQRISLGAVVFASLVINAGNALACSAKLSSTGAVYTKIQDAFLASAMVDTIVVDGLSGVCSENIILDNSRLRTILTGINNAVIAGNSLSATIDSRTKGTVIQNLLINGGNHGIIIQRNANTIVDNVTVQSAVNNGIYIHQFAFGVVQNSIIQSNGNHGISVAEGAGARIGFNQFSDATFRSNYIQFNGGNGILIQSNSTAKIFSNYIISNANSGVFVEHSSSADVANNVINSNLDGISANFMSSVRLANVYPPVGVQDYPNITTAPNIRNGMVCLTNSSVSGHIGGSNQVTGGYSQFGGLAINGVPANGFSPNCAQTVANAVQVP